MPKKTKTKKTKTPDLTDDETLAAQAFGMTYRAWARADTPELVAAGLARDPSRGGAQ